MADSKISALTSLTGASVDGAADVLAIVDTSVTTTKKITVDEALLAMLASTTNARFKVGTFGRDISSATGTQAISGVGFKPKAILFSAGVSGGGNASLGGYDDAITASCLSLLSGSFFPSNTSSIFYFVDVSNFYAGKINSFDTDGFTIGWTKTLLPTGTLTVTYQAFR